MRLLKIFLLIFSLQAFAGDPGVFEIQTLGKHDFTYRLDMNYRTLSSSNQGFKTDLIRSGNGFIPVLSTGDEVNSEILILTPSITYGLTKKISLSSSLNYLTINNRKLVTLEDGSKIKQNTSDHYISDINIGINYQSERLDSDDTCSCLLSYISFISAGLNATVASYNSISSNRLEFNPGETISMTAGVVKIVDEMIVLSINGSYQYTKIRDIDGVIYDFHDAMYLTPMVRFVATPKITFNSSFTWQQVKPILNNETNITRTSLEAGVGLDYTVSKDFIFGVSLNNDLTGDQGASVNLSFIYN